MSSQPKFNQILSNTFRTRIALENSLVLCALPMSDVMIIARDIDWKGGKSFHRLPVSGIGDKLPKLLEYDYNLYEVLPPNYPVKLYFDLEMEKEGITSDEGIALTGEFVMWVNKHIFELYQIEVEVSDYMLFDCCRENKISFHLIAQNKLCFENVAALKQFIIYLRQRMEDEPEKFSEQFVWHKGEEKRFIFDTIPYSNFQCYRMVGQSKKGKAYKLDNPNNVEPIHTLVRIYDGIGDKTEIKFNPTFETKNRTKNTKSTNSKTKTKNDTATATAFQTNGLTLMELHNVDFDELRTYPEHKQYLYLIPNTAQPRDIFLYVGFALKKAGGTENDYREWARLSSKYTTGRNVDNFHKFTIGERSYGLPYLKHLAKQAHPEYFDEGLELLEAYFKPDYKDIRIIKEDCRFVSLENSPHENNIFAPEQLLLLRAHLGYGKTTAILRLIERNGYIRVLFLSPRITFSQFISTEFGTEFYLNENADLTADRLTISVESLYKLRGVEPYDCIILDECEAILSVFSSPTLRGKQIDTFNLLGDFIRASKKTVFAGAFITQKSIDFILSFNLPAVCVWNTNPPRPKKAVQYHKDIFILKAAESMAAGHKNYYLYSSLTALNTDFAKLKGMSTSNPVIKNTLEHTLIYSSESDDKMVRKTLANINKCWGEATSIAATPAITVGNSYSPATADVDSIFINAAPTCIVADTFQGHERVRRTKTDTLYFCLPTDKHLNLAKSFFNLKLDIIRNYDQHNQQKFQQTLRLITELIQCEKRQFIQRDTTGQYISRLEYFAEELGNKITPPALKQLMMFNFMEQTLSNCYYAEMFFRFLQLNNYTIVSTATQPTEAENAAIEKIDSGAVDCVVKYADIPIIMPETLQHLKYKQTHKDASRLEKLQIARHFFDELIDNNIPDYAKQHYFTQYLSSHEKHYLENLREEVKGNMKHTILNKLDTEAATECISMMPMRLNYVLALNKALGVPNTSTGGVVITRETIVSLNDYIHTEYENINSAFGFAKLKNTEKWEFKHTQNMIQKIYKSWSKYELELTKKDRDKKALEYTTRTSIIYEGQDGTKIPPFAPLAPPQQQNKTVDVRAIINSLENKIKLCIEQSPTSALDEKKELMVGGGEYQHPHYIKNTKQHQHSSSKHITNLLFMA